MANRVRKILCFLSAFGSWPKYLLFAERVVVGGTNWFLRGNSCECRGDNMSLLFFVVRKTHTKNTFTVNERMRLDAAIQLTIVDGWAGGQTDEHCNMVVVGG